jgi:hypothetical protein
MGAARSNPSQRARCEPLFDVDPRTGVSIEVFYTDPTLETFGSGEAGWFWWSRRRGYAPVGSLHGPFATSYAAYRQALGTALGTKVDALSNFKAKSGG